MKILSLGDRLAKLDDLKDKELKKRDKEYLKEFEKDLDSFLDKMALKLHSDFDSHYNGTYCFSMNINVEDELFPFVDKVFKDKDLQNFTYRFCNLVDLYIEEEKTIEDVSIDTKTFLKRIQSFREPRKFKFVGYKVRCAVTMCDE